MVELADTCKKCKSPMKYYGGRIMYGLCRICNKEDYNKYFPEESVIIAEVCQSFFEYVNDKNCINDFTEDYFNDDKCADIHLKVLKKLVEKLNNEITCKTSLI
jgi:hypothetical protein